MHRLINGGFEWGKANYQNIDWYYLSNKWEDFRASNEKKIKDYEKKNLY